MYVPDSLHWWSKTQQSQLVAIAVASMVWQRFEEIVVDRSGYILWTSESYFGVFVNYLKLAGSKGLSFRTGINNSFSVARAPILRRKNKNLNIYL